jgi:hypothetical protein
MPPPGTIDRIQWYRVLPWLHLLRAFRLAIDPRKILLASAAVLLVSCGTWLLQFWPGETPAGTTPEAAAIWPWDLDARAGLLESPTPQPENVPLGESRPEPSGVSKAWQQGLRVAQSLALPFRAVAGPVRRIFLPRTTVSSLFRALSALLIALVVWTLLGGAISRIAAVQFATDQQISVASAIWYAATRWHDYLTGPLLASTGILGLSLLAAGIGALARIPGAGPALVAVLWGLSVLIGILLAVMLFGLALGWPTMFVTISVDGTDGFDGFSRAYNYLLERPVTLLWCVFVAAVHGVVMTTLLWFAAQVVLYLTAWGVSWGSGSDNLAMLFHGFAIPVGLRPFANDAVTAPAGGSTGQIILGAWINLFLVLLHGFVHSYFWSAATIVYFLLRQQVDGNELDQVYLGDSDEDDELLPLVGPAAIKAAEAKRSSRTRVTEPVGATPSVTESMNVPPPPVPPQIDLTP